jgi:hypothetical protein
VRPSVEGAQIEPIWHVTIGGHAAETTAHAENESVADAHTYALTGMLYSWFS